MGDTPNIQNEAIVRYSLFSGSPSCSKQRGESRLNLTIKIIRKSKSLSQRYQATGRDVASLQKKSADRHQQGQGVGLSQPSEVVQRRVRASEGIVNRIMKPKSKPELRSEKTARAACATTRASSANRSFPVIAMAASAGGLKALLVIL